MEFTTSEFFGSLAVMGAIGGFIVGLIPMVLGFRKGKRSLGFIGLLSCLVVGVFGFLLAIIPAAIFSWLILKKNKVTPDHNADRFIN